MRFDILQQWNNAALRILGRAAGCAALAASAAAGSLQAQSSPPSVTIRSKADSYTQTQVDTVEWCDDDSLVPQLRKIWLNGEDVTSSFTYATASKAGCTRFARSVGTVTLQPGGGKNVLRARIYDQDGNEGNAFADIYYFGDPLLDLAPHNGENRDVALCIEDCFDAVVGYSTPAYVSLDAPRSASLVYRASQAHPVSTVQVDVTDDFSPTATKLSLKLMRVDGAWVTFTNGTTEIFFAGGAGVSRLAAQFADSTTATGAVAYTLVASYWNGSSLLREKRAPLRVLVSNERASAFGWGWSMPGMQRLIEQDGGSVVITGGDGSIAYFVGTQCQSGIACTLASPPGDFTTVTRSVTGSYERRYPDGTVVAYGGGGAGWITTVKDRFNNTTTFAYSSGLLSTITDPAGTALTFYYGADSKLDSIADPGGRRTRVTIDAAGNVTQVKDPMGIVTLGVTYDANHRVRQRTDRRGGVRSFAYDFAGKLAADTLPQVRADIGLVRPVLGFVSPERAVLVDTASGSGSSASPASRVLPDSVRARTLDAKGITTRYALDRFGAPVRIEQPHGLVTLLERNSHSLVTRSATPDGRVLKNSWTGHKLTQVQDSTLNTTQTISYEPTYSEITRIAGTGIDTIFNYWSAGKLDSTKTGKRTNPATRFSHDAKGRRTGWTDPAGHSGSMSYAATGFQNLASVTYGGASTTYGTDAFGRRDLVTDRVGVTTLVRYDSLNRVVTAIRPLGDTTRYAYDSLFLRSVTDAVGQQYQFAANALGRVERASHPDGASDSARYDVNGLLVTSFNRRGQAIQFAYDSVGRVISRTAGSDTTRYAHDPAGRWIAVSNAESIDTLVRAPVARTDSAITRRGGTRYVLVSRYDTKGRRETLAAGAPWADTVSYHYDANGSLDTLVDLSGRKTVLNFNSDRQPTGVTLPTSPAVMVTHSFPSTHVPAQITYNTTSNDDVLGRKYEHDDDGRVHVRLNSKMNAGREYYYDALGRLRLERSFSYPPGSEPSCPAGADHGFQCDTAVKTYIDTTLYTYDKVGNRTDRGALTGVGNRLFRFDGDSLLYDADGNLVRRFRIADSTGFNQRLVWNALGQLVEVQTTRSGVGTTVTFGYDGFGRRVRKTVGGVTTRYVWDGANLAAEVDASAPTTPVAEYTHYPAIDAPHSMRRDGKIYYYTTQLPAGTVSALLDSTGARAARYEYTSFGETTTMNGLVANPLRFAGREYDEESGFYYNRARYYDPELARFVSEDPIGLNGGGNVFVYSGNDPVNATDPTGLYAEVVCVATEWWDIGSNSSGQITGTRYRGIERRCYHFTDRGGDGFGPIAPPSGDSPGGVRPGMAPELPNVMFQDDSEPYLAQCPDSRTTFTRFGVTFGVRHPGRWIHWQTVSVAPSGVKVPDPDGGGYVRPYSGTVVTTDFISSDNYQVVGTVTCSTGGYVFHSR